VTATLSNLEVFGSADTTISENLRIDMGNPPASFIYKSTYVLTIIASVPLSGIPEQQVKPFFVPIPYNHWFYEGDSFTLSFGDAYGLAGHAIRVTLD
jgi:hypothetical protein